jgi:hypothetical protein
VRERLADTPRAVAALTADLERAKFEKRAARAPMAIPAHFVSGYLLELRRLAKTDVPRAKQMLVGLLDGDMILTPATADQPARVTGRLAPSGLLVPVFALRG